VRQAGLGLEEDVRGGLEDDGAGGDRGLCAGGVEGGKRRSRLRCGEAFEKKQGKTTTSSRKLVFVFFPLSHL
jgi:hypothetical protein